VERAILSGKGKEVVTADLRLAPESVGLHIPSPAGPSGPPLTSEGIDLPAVQESIEKRYIEEALRLASGKETKASQLLGVNYHTFRYRRKRLGL
jgi:DNA-binding NtrC family response regulator